MKCVDNVIFSKDGKTLMSYAINDERSEYTVPEGTEEIGKGAFRKCKKLQNITFPDSVRLFGEKAFIHNDCSSYNLPPNVEVIPDRCFGGNAKLTKFNIPENSKLTRIDDFAFCDCDNLSEVKLPSFEVSIAKHAFSFDSSKSREVTLKSYVKPQVTAERNCIKWDSIPGASYYEVYQKLKNGEYRLMNTTKATSCKISSLKSGKEYVFAVKPFAVIEAEDGEEYDIIFHHECPDTFTIEGTMSEDVAVKGD